jgi:nucleotide-binding universal stress UspA family protein
VRWVVGIELRGICGGAMTWALALTHRQAPDDALFGVHVTSRSDAIALAERALHEYIGDCRADGRFSELRAAESDDVSATLSDALEAFAADALVLGRPAPRDGSGWPRLGSVVRRLLRTLPASVFVVPFDLDALASGPVVAATDLMPDSVDACRFAARIAQLLERPLQIVHVASSTTSWSGAPLGPAELGDIESDARHHAAALLVEFAHVHALPHEHGLVLQGEPVDELRNHVAAIDATAIVLGSRRLGVISRIFSASVGTELAAIAPCPVAIVPPAAPHPA